jgi:hypothetical protein
MNKENKHAAMIPPRYLSKPILTDVAAVILHLGQDQFSGAEMA